MAPEKEFSLPGPYSPTLILHGGAGNITRKNLPPALYDQFETSLLKYLDSTRQKLKLGASALESAVHAVSLMEDDPLFNCSRGSVFTEKGTIEMEASVMVASVDPGRAGKDGLSSVAARQKRGASVSLVRNTRHPIQLAKEVLLIESNGKDNSMHCQLSGRDVEEWGWKEKGLEWKDDGWFWTKKRWAEHLRGLPKDSMREKSGAEATLAEDSDITSPVDDSDDTDDTGDEDDENDSLPSQGTVGAVCMDSWGDIAVATSTGGQNNKKAGRIGDTPTLGAGFWAESWDESVAMPARNSDLSEPKTSTMRDRLTRAIDAGFGDLLEGCLPSISSTHGYGELLLVPGIAAPSKDCSAVENFVEKQPRSDDSPGMLYAGEKMATQRRAVAMSGTGNGDTILRTCGCRTTAAICRYSVHSPPSKQICLAAAVNMTAGRNGEMQQSAGNRWSVTGEGQAGMIGIEVWSDTYESEEKRARPCSAEQPRRTGRVVFDFNCGGLFRALVDENTGKGQVMVFRESYYQSKDQR